MNGKIKKIVILGVLLAAQVVAGRFLTIATLYAKIGFIFLPIAIAAILYGPVWAGVSAAVGDVLVAMLLPYGYFPGITLSAFFTGAIYGLFLYRKPMKMWRIAGSVLIINVVISIFMQAFWLYLLTGKGFLVLLPTRVMQNVIMTPIQIAGIRLVAYRIAALELSPRPLKKQV